MLQKEELIGLLKKEKYLEIRNIFRREYKRILIEYAQNNGIDISDNPPLIFLLKRIECKFPNLRCYTGLISKVFFCENVPSEDALSLMIDNYNKIKEALK